METMVQKEIQGMMDHEDHEDQQDLMVPGEMWDELGKMVWTVSMDAEVKKPQYQLKINSLLIH